MDRYVDPLVSHLKAMLNYRKFRRGTKAEVDELLKIEKLEFPMRIVYCFGISHEHPGTFILTYIRSTNPHHEYVGLYPKGFKFRKRMFDSIDRLVAHFQKYIDEPQHESGPSIRSVAAMVPMRSPATGGSSGASAGSGWGGSTNEGGWRGQSFDRDRSSTPSSRTGEVCPQLKHGFATFMFDEFQHINGFKCGHNNFFSCISMECKLRTTIFSFPLSVG